ncbi:MAG TPA: FAD-binding protein [Candidatus Binataceae bacterium]|nr:FAD-binding protein [Candidatus Binataceae bacterium]
MALKIAACVKQIPLIEDVNFDPVTKTIKRDGPNVMNALDLNAVAYAAEFRQKLGAQTTVLTMGPPQAREVLIQALAMGMEEAVHLEDRAFAGADTLATARALAAWLGPRAFDLILMGRYSLDSETGQVGPEVAELLGIAQITNVIELTLEGEVVRVVRESDDGHEEVQCRLPALLTCAERKARPPRVTPAAMEAAKLAPIALVRAADLHCDPALLGAKGSPTWVQDVMVEEPRKVACKFIDTGDPQRAADEVVAELDRMGVLKAARPPGRPIPAQLRPSKAGREVWVVYETAGDQVSRGSLELLSAGDELAGKLGSALVAVGLSGPDLRPILASYGADRAILFDHPTLTDGRPESIVEALAPLVVEARPFALLVNASELGRDWGPRLAARLGLGLTGDAIRLALDGEGRMVAYKPAFGGHVIAPIISRTFPQMATVRSGVLPLADPRPGRGPIELETLRPSLPAPRTTLLARKPLLDPMIKPLEGAEIVVGIGVGVGGPPGVARVKEFARAINAALCATRRVTDLGWAPRQIQVGLTGKAIEPLLYLAVGVRGVPNHTIGLKRIHATVAINKDRNAPIFERAEIGLVSDWAAILPALEAALSARLGRS